VKTQGKKRENSNKLREKIIKRGKKGSWPRKDQRKNQNLKSPFSIATRREKNREDREGTRRAIKGNKGEKSLHSEGGNKAWWGKSQEGDHFKSTNGGGGKTLESARKKLGKALLMTSV